MFVKSSSPPLGLKFGVKSPVRPHLCQYRREWGICTILAETVFNYIIANVEYAR